MPTFPPIAIVGAGVVFPDAPTPDAFWGNLRARADACRAVPPGRWVLHPDAAKRAGPHLDRVYTDRACLVDSAPPNDAAADLDLPVPAAALDPVHRFALYAACQALASARLEAIDRRRIGVVLAAIALPTDGACEFTHALLARDARPAPPSTDAVWRSRVTSLPASIVARANRFGGPCFTLDAACASSLYAVKLACDQLHAGRADAMLAGGVSRPDSLFTQMGFSRLRALSPSGVCRPFDARSDGLVVGEGAGAFLLKRLDDALRAGDDVLGVIRGIGLANDIDGGLLAPADEGQLRAMRAAYEAAGWRPDSVDLIECHGTGTPLGDATELRALRALWEQAAPSASAVIGSVKSNVGHLLTAAGAAGLAKALLALGHRVLPPTANVEARGSAASGSQFRVLEQALPWPSREHPRRAAVSAFGFGGINAHVLIEEAPASNAAASPPAFTPPLRRAAPVAIVGMAAHVGGLRTLAELQRAALRGASALDAPPPQRWHGLRPADRGLPAGAHHRGAFIGQLDVPVGRHLVPPAEIAEVLPQQLLMLDVAATAMDDAGLPPREARPRTGAFVGISFDFEATNFHLRWQHLATRREAPAAGANLPPPLTAARTVGALGSIVASRLAREFRLGGPCFVLSAEEASGLVGAQLACHALQNGELDLVLVGAVDFAADVRQVIAAALMGRLSRSGRIRPFDAHADGTGLSDGAAAVVLKRLDDAVRDGDRVYAVIRGVGLSASGGLDPPHPAPAALRDAMDRAYADAGLDATQLDYLEAHGSGVPAEDATEAEAIAGLLSRSGAPVAVGSLAPIVGQPGAATGLAALVRAAACLHAQMLPPLVDYESPGAAIRWPARVHVPRRPLYWARDRARGPRVAGVSSLTCDGVAAHAVLCEYAAP